MQDKLRACAGVQTPAGKAHVRWDGAVTPLGQLAYFIAFLHLTGLWAHGRDSCPLQDRSPNAPGKSEVLGTWRLSNPAGHRRYAHVTAMRGDCVNPALLGMGKMISEDAPRRALLPIPKPRASPGPTPMSATARSPDWVPAGRCAGRRLANC